MEKTTKTFGMATYNIFDGRSGQRIVDNILKLIQDGASIICLQEIWPLYRNVSMSEAIDKHLPTNFKSQYFLGDGPGAYDYGLGILWNTDIFSAISFNRLPLPLKNDLTLSDKLFFWAVKLTPRIFKRGAFIGTFMYEGKEVRITNLYLDFQGGDAHRAKQLQALTSYLRFQPMVDNEIICGDFNTVGLFQKKNKITMLEKLLGEGFKSVLRKPYTSAIIQQLDYIFVKNLETRTAKILRLRGSDHYPLLAKVNHIP